MQVSKMLDNETVAKIWRSAQLCIATTLILVVPVITAGVIDFLKNGTPIDWITPLVLTIGVASTWLVNTAKEWYAGVDQSKGMPTNSSGVSPV